MRTVHNYPRSGVTTPSVLRYSRIDAVWVTSARARSQVDFQKGVCHLRPDILTEGLRLPGAKTALR